MRRAIHLSVLVLLVLISIFAVSPAEAQTVFRRWLDDGKVFTCSPMGGTIQVLLNNQNVEFSNLPVDAEFTINYIKDGVITTDGPFTVEQTSGTRNYGSFATTFPAYPLTFEFRLDTLISGVIVYQSSLIVNCSADATVPVTPSNVDLSSGSSVRFRRWLDDGKILTCTDTGPNIQVSLNNQNVEFYNLPVDAEFTINYIKNGVITTDGPFTVEQTSGTRNYGSFATTFPAYPLTFEFRLDTLIGGVIVYQSSLIVSCSADATVPVTPVNVDLTAGTPGGGSPAYGTVVLFTDGRINPQAYAPVVLYCTGANRDTLTAYKVISATTGILVWTYTFGGETPASGTELAGAAGSYLTRLANGRYAVIAPQTDGKRYMFVFDGCPGVGTFEVYVTDPITGEYVRSE